MKIDIEMLGAFRPPMISCVECKVREITQGAGLIFRIKVGTAPLDLCDRHIAELEIAIESRLDQPARRRT